MAGRCFSCKKFLNCGSFLTKINNIDTSIIYKICRNNGGYENVFKGKKL